MKWDALIYGSSTGNTEEVAESIAKALSIEEVNDISEGDFAELVANHDFIVLGTSTWGMGDLQDDWDEIIDDVKEADLSGKTVALFGLGDQSGYPESFVDGIGLLHEAVVEAGAKVVGATSTDGYDFEESGAVVDGNFVGLVLDQDNQEDMTEERVSAWAEKLLKL